MDHKYIEQFDLVDRYLTRRLTADETAQFEEHFVSCTKCSEELWTTEDFIEGLRRGRNYKAATRPAYAWLPWLSFLPEWATLATAFLLIVSITSAAIFVNRMRRSRIETEQARSQLSQREQSLEEERREASLAESRHQETLRELSAQLAQLQAQLRKQESIAGVNQNEASKPIVNLAIFVLKSPRASKQSPGPINDIIVPHKSSSFVLYVLLEGKPGYQDYRMTILNDQNRLVWSDRGLTPDRYNSLSVEFNSTFFRNGEYLLKLEGISGDGRASVVSEYSFRVTKTP